MLRCTRCVLPGTYPNITFNSDGVCNFCVTHQPPQYMGEEALVKRINKLRDPSCGYDAIIALSGGRDSTYTAYYIAKKLGYKVIAITIDNGMMPATTRTNIDNTVKILNIDHQIIRSARVKDTASHVLRGLSHRPSPAMVAFLCTGCTTGLIEGYQKISNELNCPLIIKGGGEPEQSYAEQLLSGSIKRDRSSMLRGFVREIFKNPHYIKPNVMLSFFNEYLARFKRAKQNYSSIQLFNYIEWNEEEILSTITREFNWRTPEKMASSWRSDCKINIVRQYYYKELLGFTKNDELLSQMIRNKNITRDDALNRLEIENVLNPELIREIFQELGIPNNKIESLLVK